MGALGALDVVSGVVRLVPFYGEEKRSALSSVKDVRLRRGAGSLQPRRELLTGPNCPEGYLELMESS